MAEHLQQQIDELKRMLLDLGALVEQSVQQSVAAALDRRDDQARRVIADDERIDHAEIEIEERCLQIMALHQPVAHDLRFIVAMLKINNDLERIGDLAVNLAEQARALAGEAPVKTFPFDLEDMSRRVQAMLRKSLNALVNLDEAQAQEVRGLDDEVDALHRQAFETVERTIGEDTSQIEQMIHLLNISRQLERIADHATNVAKDVLYLISGEIVRHRRARQRREQQRRQAHDMA